MIGVLGPLLLAVNLAAPIETQVLTSDYWVSAVGLYRIKVPHDWQMSVKAEEETGMLEDLRVGPKKEPTVSVTILTRRSDRPLTSIEDDALVRQLLAGYKKKYQDVHVERGPNRVPLGNIESWGYLIIYNTVGADGTTKIAIRETVNYVNRRMNDLAYLHHIIVGRCPLPVAYTYSPQLSRFMENLLFQLPDKPTGGSAKKPAQTQDDEEDDDDSAASPAPAAPHKPAKSP